MTRSTNKPVSAPVHGRRLMARAACVVALALTAVIAMPQAAASSDANRTTASTTDDANAANSVDDSTDGALTPAEADALLGATDGMPEDRVWTLVGEADGVHVLSAVQADGYAWTDIAVLGTELDTTDKWISNGCLTADGRTLAVVYAPSTYASNDRLFRQGARGALVNLETGAATDLGSGYTLSYFNPGCGEDTRVAFTAFHTNATVIDVISVDGAAESAHHEFEGQVTSAIPIGDEVVAARENTIVSTAPDRNEIRISTEHGQVHSLLPYSSGGVAYAVTDAERAHAYVRSDLSSNTPSREIATSAASDLHMVATAGGEVIIAGAGITPSADLPADTRIANAGASTRTSASSQGELLVSPALKGRPVSSSLDSEQPIAGDLTIEVIGIESETEHEFTLNREILDAVHVPALADESSKTTTPGVAESPCAIPRNDPSVQAYQPGLEEVEWAATRAVFGTLDNTDGAQSLFPLPSLSGGGRVPVQVLLGILAQESNLWQASRYTTRGITGNPLIGDYYGARSESSAGWWDPHYADADCGYGIAQVTDGMRTGATPYAEQLAIATDYRSNIARGLQILIEKWNQTRDAGLIINDGDPQYVENWFFALWAYNSGFYPRASMSEPWGVGWLNNPANPIYPPNRQPFLQMDAADAAHPQDWPYPEKVLGFAANPPWLLSHVTQDELGDHFEDAPAFAYSWWSTADDRVRVKPPRQTFCNVSNNCDIYNLVNVDGSPSPCANQYNGSYDLRCWYHAPVTWKTCDPECGHENLVYSSTSPKPDRPPTSYDAVCDTEGLPSGALVIDAVPAGTSQSRNCAYPVGSAGEFSFAYPGSTASDAAKVDLHQLGSGFNGGFFFTHARQSDLDPLNATLEVEGTWRLDRDLHQWARVFVHMPDNGAWAQQATYKVNTGGETYTRTLAQKNFANTWLNLGAFSFSGTPSISLSSTEITYDEPVAEDASGVEDIAWDAVAIVPLTAKPTDIVVALGDSYSSGEGTSPVDGSGFYRSSDFGGGKSPAINRNACHRSPLAWSYNVTLPGRSSTIRELVESGDPTIDYHLLACSGAEIQHVLPADMDGRPKYLERTQIDMGYLSADTTLVTLTIGGNDIGFSHVLTECIIENSVFFPCQVGLKEETANKLAALPSSITELLNTIHAKAENARILVQGYPSLFADGAGCLPISDVDRDWLNSVAAELNRALTEATSGLSYVTYQNPNYKFLGRTLCANDHAIHQLIWEHTPGDLSSSIGLPPSAQSIHPNAAGAELYASSASDALHYSHSPLQASITGGAATTYYGTARYHSVAGSVAFNVREFDECGDELRIGLRGAGSGNTQITETLSWDHPNDLQHFRWDDAQTQTTFGYSIPAGNYSINARLVTSCSAGTEQEWKGVLSW